MDDVKCGMAQSGIHAGFPSPATDYMTQAIDLNKELVRHPAATFYGRVVGDSMIDAGVDEGDILVIDKSLEPQDGDMAVCFVDGEFTLKQVEVEGREDDQDLIQRACGTMAQDLDQYFARDDR